MKTFLRRAVLFALVLSPLTAPAQPFIFPPPPPDLTMIFRPFETEHVTLSPDGKHLAYTERQGEALFLIIHDLEANTRNRMFVGADRAFELSGAREKTPSEITFLRWAASGRLVFNLNQRNVWSIRADGSDTRRMADPRDFEAPPVIVAPSSAHAPPPPPIMEMLEMDDQPVTVVALPRGDDHVYVEAIMWNHLPSLLAARAAVMDALGGPPERGVLRINVETGRSQEWGEAMPRSTSLMTDQQGHPRIAVLQRSRHATPTTFMYADRRSSRWLPLDTVLGSEVASGFHVNALNYLGKRSFPLGFDYDPEILYFASNVGRDTFGIYAVNTKTRQRTEVAVETQVADLVSPFASATAIRDSLIFDGWERTLTGVRIIGAERTTLWIDPEISEIQRLLDAVDPEKRWEILEWDKSRTRFLVLASNRVEPGIYYLFNSESLQLDEVMTRAPWLSEAGRNPSTSFGFQTPTGVNLSGYLTLPRKPILERPPLVVLCHDGPWDRDYPDYDREAQALAWMGFMVLQVNFRGSSGFGQEHLNALRAGFDSVALDDVLAAIDAVTPKNVDRRLVAIMGKGYGGYLALRAMQLHPKRFRCAVAFDAPTDLVAWANPTDFSDELTRASSELSFFSSPWARLKDSHPVFIGEVRHAFLGSDPAKLRNLSPLAHPDKITGPVMLIQNENFSLGRGREFARAVARAGRHVEFISLNQDEGANLPHARAVLFTKIHGFLNENIYNYAVTLGDAVEVDAEKD